MVEHVSYALAHSGESVYFSYIFLITGIICRYETNNAYSASRRRTAVSYNTA
jgi:hypothetical protein